MAEPFPQDVFLEGYFAPMGMECEAPDLIIEGELPSDLNGVYFRNGPDPLHGPREGEAYHWFHGDGMIQRWEFDNGRVNWRNRWVRTRKYELERAAGKSLFGVLGNPFNMGPSVAGEPYNTANTHIVYHGNRLMALMEGTNAVLMDPANLDTLQDFDTTEPSADLSRLTPKSTLTLARWCSSVARPPDRAAPTWVITSPTRTAT